MRKIVLDELEKVLSANAMKRITGGYGGGSGNCCAYNTHGGYGGTCLTGGGGPVEAEFMAGPNGWWACNTQEVLCNCCGKCD